MGQEIEILIVEEDLTQAEHLKHILEQHDHKVSVEHNAQLALAAIRRHKPQIVISSVLLPGMDGYALCREIKSDENLNDIPVILLTSLSDAKDVIRGLECGADNFVTKPYDEKLLISRIEYIVLNRELRVSAGTQMGLEIVFNGEKYSITPERQQIVDLLISTYEAAVQKTLELQRVEKELNALNEHLEEEVKQRTAKLVEEVAERRQAEEALLNSEQTYRELVENMPAAVYVCDSSGLIESYNRRAVELWGRSPKPRDASDCFCGSYRMYKPDGTELTHAESPMANVLRTGIPVMNQVIFIERPDGSRRTAIANIIPRRDVQGNLISAINCLIDITEREQAEDALRESEERYHRFFDEVLVGVYISTPDGRLLACNPAFARIFGFASVEDAMKTGLAAIYPDSQSREALLNLLREKRKLEFNDMELRRRDGGVVHVIESVVGVFDEQDALVEIKGYFLDNTERKLAEQSLIESEERLRQSQKMEAIGTLAGGVAHDFNNLLTVILGNTHLVLRKLQPDDPAQPRLIEVEKAGNRAAVLTRQLLAFSRRQHLQRRTVNLNDTISEVMTFLRRIIGEDIEVSVIAAAGLSTTFADPAQIEQVIMNLAVNARDAMPRGGHLTIETSNVALDESYQRQYPYVNPGKYVQIRVSDSGSGIDAETQKHIFEPFFTTKEVNKGTGLGLSMVYGIIKQHDGHINVYSEVGHGTTFKIFLPVAGSAVEKESPAIQLPLLGGTETILVAEDEEALRNLARAVLEGLDYTVLLAKDGEEAVDMYKANRERIDMLLLDVVMPRMSGIEAYQRIRELGGDVPMIFMTGYSTETVQSRFVKQNELMEELGAIVLQKPYNIEGLGRKLREVLDKSKGHD